THYGPAYGFTPYQNNISEHILTKDMADAKAIINNDIEHFNYKHNICGINALILWLKINTYFGSLVAYDRSNNSDNSVSYMGIIFCLNPLNDNIYKINTYQILKLRIHKAIQE